MDLLQLEHFLAVVEEGTFTRAAERVSRTQPAVSQSIKKLEEEIGGQLFARDLQGNDSGEFFLWQPDGPEAWPPSCPRPG